MSVSDAADVLARFLAGPVRSAVVADSTTGSVRFAPHKECTSSHSAKEGSQRTQGIFNAIVLCGSAVLPLIAFAAKVFRNQLERRTSGASVEPLRFFITGGIGHSTELFVEAVRNNPTASGIIEGSSELLPEAVLTRLLLTSSYFLPSFQIEPFTKEEVDNFVEIEGESTNCGMNAERTVPLILDWWRKQNKSKQRNSSTEAQPLEVLLIQEPTMCRRSHHAFELHFAKCFAKLLVLTAPIAKIPKRHYGEDIDDDDDDTLHKGKEAVCLVIPTVNLTSETIPPYLGRFQNDEMQESEKQGTTQNKDAASPHEIREIDQRPLPWEKARYLGLLLGEIPRLQTNGYGPSGSGFISHCSIPDKVQQAFALLKQSSLSNMANR